MSHKNKNNYNYTSVPYETETVAEETVETQVEVTETPVVEEVDKKCEEIVTGFVSNCKRLRVRAEASVESENLGSIAEGTEVVILPFEDDKFYKVTTATGLDGYCMKDYITIKTDD